MILVTVGLQEPFDRLIRAVDEWAAARCRSDVFAQIGRGKYLPKHMQFTSSVDPLEFRRLVQKANVVVAHAGVGSILSALELGKPIVIMPRRARLHEQRNDHQIATAKRLGARGLVMVAEDERALSEKLDRALTLASSPRIHEQAPPEIIGAIRSFLAGPA